MLFDPKHDISLERLARDARLAPAPTRDLFIKVSTLACPRIQLLRTAGKARRLDQLIEAGAWTDAATTLIGLELPQWRLRRAVYEDGEWICSLSREPNLPMDVDDTADSHHELLALAILGAFVEALRRTVSERNADATVVPQIRAATGHAISCENFA
jgi:hypothetical protein